MLLKLPRDYGRGFDRDSLRQQYTVAYHGAHRSDQSPVFYLADQRANGNWPVQPVSDLTVATYHAHLQLTTSVIHRFEQMGRRFAGGASLGK